MPNYLIIDKDTGEPEDLIYLEPGTEKKYLEDNPNFELQEDMETSEIFDDEDYIDEEEEW